MFKLGVGELVIIFLIILVLFGATKLPEIAKSLAQAIHEFKKAGKDSQDSPEKDNDKKSS